MGNYLSLTENDREEMLKTIGIHTEEELFGDIPEKVRLDGLKLPDGMSEMETDSEIRKIASKNKVFGTIFRGAGAYRHYIPSIVKSVTSKEEFVTAYTPYQAEISQGILQSIFEYQTMICALTGMDISNASVYDGACAAAEALNMCRDRKHNKALLASGLHPEVKKTIGTYTHGNGMQVEYLPDVDGVMALDSLEKALQEDGIACVCVQQPNYYGLLEPAEEIGALCKKYGVKYIMSVNPISLGLLKTPAECGADIAVGEGQPLGMELAFGGPYLGFMASTKKMMRSLPGRIVGETIDEAGRRAYVLTLQAREQHIRREKASSNICSNEALCALTASVYLAAVGPEGLYNAASSCCSKAHYFADRLEAIGYKKVYQGEFFHEFVTIAPVGAKVAVEQLGKNNILGGLPLPDGNLLWCCTEMNTKDEIDRAVEILKRGEEE